MTTTPVRLERVGNQPAGTSVMVSPVRMHRGTAAEVIARLAGSVDERSAR